MSRPAAPALTVRYDGSERTFAAGHDVVVGRDLRADVRIAHPLISRAHLVLRFDHGRWMAIDNGSLNGMFVNGRRIPSVDITDGQTLNIGNPDGPAVNFEVGRHQGSAGRPPQTSSVRVTAPPSTPSWPASPSQGASTAGSWQPPPSHPHPTYPPPAPPRVHPARQRGRRAFPCPAAPPPAAAPTQMRPIENRSGGTSNIATSMLKILRPGAPTETPPGGVKIGRATDNDIVIPDVLASRHHATLIPTPGGMEIADNRSINGTFVNGTRVDTALLNEGDVVTIGNVDLVFAGGTLVRRTETEAATAHRRTRSARRHLDHRAQQDAAGEHLVLGAPRHADRGDRPVGCRQVHAGAADRRLHPPDQRHGGVRGAQHPRRVRLAAQPDRDGAPGRRGARTADGRTRR